MSRTSAAYLSYLLRLWREGEGGQAWRASLESVASGEQRGFPGLDALFAYLRLETSSVLVQDDRRPDAHEGQGYGPFASQSSSAQARGDSTADNGEEVISQQSASSGEPASNRISAESNASQEKESNP